MFCSSFLFVLLPCGFIFCIRAIREPETRSNPILSLVDWARSAEMFSFFASLLDASSALDRCCQLAYDPDSGLLCLQLVPCTSAGEFAFYVYGMSVITADVASSTFIVAIFTSWNLSLLCFSVQSRPSSQFDFIAIN